MLTEQERADQRAALVKHLVAHPLIQNWKLKVVRGHGSGSGRSDFTNNGQIAPCSMTNWKWVEIQGTVETEALVEGNAKARARDFVCVVSLNIPTEIPSTGRCIAIFDQIGLVICDGKGIPLDIHLPLTSATRDEIAEKVIEQLKLFLGI